MTRFPGLFFLPKARRSGTKDCEPGYLADINLIDFDSLGSETSQPQGIRLSDLHSLQLCVLDAPKFSDAEAALRWGEPRASLPMGSNSFRDSRARFA